MPNATAVVMDQLNNTEKNNPFGPTEEESIIALAIEHPEFFNIVAPYLEVDHFHKIETKFIFRIIKFYFDKHETVPTRGMLHDIAKRKLTVDDDYADDVCALLDKRLDPRDTEIIKETLVEWARNRSYGQLYTEHAYNAYENHDYDYLENLIEKARKVSAVTSSKGLWFFKNTNEIFTEDSETKLTCGFPSLDRVINEGGPTFGDVFVWMAPTGVGKSIMLVNSGVACLERKLKVLHITLELSEKKTQLRYAGAMTNLRVTNERFTNKERFMARLQRIKDSIGDGDLVIYEFPPDEISVDAIYALIDYLRKSKNWSPDVVIVDYLELMLSRHSSYNVDDYKKQKQVATEIRGLARNENVLVFTATQTNRESQKGENEPQMIGVNRVAESYGKMMPLDYVVSINQTPNDYNDDIPRVKFHVAKNRNGPKFVTIKAKVNYLTFKADEDIVSTI